MTSITGDPIIRPQYSAEMVRRERLAQAVRDAEVKLLAAKDEYCDAYLALDNARFAYRNA